MSAIAKRLKKIASKTGPSQRSKDIQDQLAEASRNEKNARESLRLHGNEYGIRPSIVRIPSEAEKETSKRHKELLAEQAAEAKLSREASAAEHKRSRTSNRDIHKFDRQLSIDLHKADRDTNAELARITREEISSAYERGLETLGNRMERFNAKPHVTMEEIRSQERGRTVHDEVVDEAHRRMAASEAATPSHSRPTRSHDATPSETRDIKHRIHYLYNDKLNESQIRTTLDKEYPDISEADLDEIAYKYFLED